MYLVALMPIFGRICIWWYRANDHTVEFEPSPKVWSQIPACYNASETTLWSPRRITLGGHQLHLRHSE